jgi:hypothetical protein
MNWNRKKGRMMMKKEEGAMQSIRIESIDLVVRSNADDGSNEEDSSQTQHSTDSSSASSLSASSDGCVARDPSPLHRMRRRISFASDAGGNVLQTEHKNTESLTEQDVQNLWYSATELKLFKETFLPVQRRRQSVTQERLEI